MNYTKMLPIPKGQSVSQWVEEWIVSIAKDVQSIETDMSRVRDRNERFSSYLPTLTMIIATYSTHIDKKRASFIKENPPAEKEGPQAYGKRVDAHLAEFQRDLEFVEGLHHDISTRMSSGQTYIRTATEEIKRAV